MTLIPEGSGMLLASAGGAEPVSAWLSNGQISWLMTPVPLPGAFWLFGTGLVGFLGLKRRRCAG
jgi:hypothetical protein